MIFCGKRVNSHIEFTFTNKEFKYMCENTNSYFLGMVLKAEEPGQIEGIFWINHYQFEILWELDQISNRRFLRPGHNGERKLCVEVYERTCSPTSIIGKMNALIKELELDECAKQDNQKELTEIVDHRISYIKDILKASSVADLYYNADIYLLQGDYDQRYQLRNEQMDLLNFSQRNEVSPFVSVE